MLPPISNTLLGRSGGLRGILALYRSRRRLAALDDDRLNDIGLTRAGAEAEARRPVWDVPRTWLR